MPFLFPLELFPFPFPLVALNYFCSHGNPMEMGILIPMHSAPLVRGSSRGLSPCRRICLARTAKIHSVNNENGNVACGRRTHRSSCLSSRPLRSLIQCQRALPRLRPWPAAIARLSVVSSPSAAAALMQPCRRRSCIPARASPLRVHVHCLSGRSFVFALHANKSLTTMHH